MKSGDEDHVVDALVEPNDALYLHDHVHEHS